MKKLLGVVFVTGVAVLSAGAARADETVKMTDMDCSALTGTPLICVKNYTKRAITNITCAGFWGTSAMSVPGGSIAPGTMTIVSFKDKCNKSLSLQTRGGNPVVIQGYDTSTNTVLNVKED